MMKFPESNRIVRGLLGTEPYDPKGGSFLIPSLPPKVKSFMYLCVASNGMGWEHVSVSIFDSHKQKGTLIVPSWDEMCHVKSVFWDDEDTVVQFHPPKSSYVNNHPACLHLWRCIEPGVEFPLPLPIMVGIPGVELFKK